VSLIFQGKKRFKKVEKKGLILGEPQPKLTKTELEVALLLSKEFLTPKQISIRRQTSVQAVYKVINKLKDKGAIKRSFDMVEKTLPTLQPNSTFYSHGIRLHGIEFNVKILFCNNRYKEVLKKSNLFYVDGNTINLYRNSLEIYGNKSFFADDVAGVMRKSVEYFHRIFVRLEHDLNIIILKNRSQNIRMVNAHFSEVNNEFARECNTRADKIRVYTRDDGKLWFMIDNSFNLHEAETLHSKTAKEDMEEVVKPFFNDLRDNKPPLLSDVMKVLNETATLHKETASGLSAVVNYMKSQIPKNNVDEEDLSNGIKPSYTG